MSVDIADGLPGTRTVFQTIGLSSESMRCSLSQSCGGVARTVKIYVEEGHTVRAEGTLVTAAAGGDAIFVGTINGHLVEKLLQRRSRNRRVDSLWRAVGRTQSRGLNKSP